MANTGNIKYSGNSRGGLDFEAHLWAAADKMRGHNYEYNQHNRVRTADGSPGATGSRIRPAVGPVSRQILRRVTEPGASRCRTAGWGSAPRRRTRASLPFFTTRNVGLGLGLAVTNKIIQTHRGKMEIPPPQNGQPGLVRLSLPLAALPGPSRS